MPEFVELIEVALRLRKYMYDNIAVVVKHPTGIRGSFVMNDTHAALL